MNLDFYPLTSILRTDLIEQIDKRVVVFWFKDPVLKMWKSRFNLRFHLWSTS